MIEISHLNKIYKSKKRKKCHALKDINLTLPDSGLVFVLGKSGSGKSTLLNLIGGLDSITSGSITVDGNNLSKFREKAFCNYRNTHIGFIFQDYHLIDELTVYDNIALSLNLRRMKALGTKNGAIVIVFGLQVFLVALLTAGLSTVGYYYFIDFANDVLFQSMQQLVPKQIVLDLDFFVYMPKVALTNCLLVFALSAISLITPMLKIKVIKPVKIIKAKE